MASSCVRLCVRRLARLDSARLGLTRLDSTARSLICSAPTTRIRRVGRSSQCLGFCNSSWSSRCVRRGYKNKFSYCTTRLLTDLAWLGLLRSLANKRYELWLGFRALAPRHNLKYVLGRACAPASSRFILDASERMRLMISCDDDEAFIVHRRLAAELRGLGSLATKEARTQPNAFGSIWGPKLAALEARTSLKSAH